MHTIMIRCPATGTAVRTEQTIDEEQFKTAQLVDQQLDPCPACRGSHVWSRRDAWLRHESVARRGIDLPRD